MSLRNLVLAARVQPHNDNQVGQRKQQLIRLLTRCLGHARNETQVAGLRQAVQVLYTDSRQGGNLRVRKDLLARFDLDHAFALNPPSNPDPERVPKRGKIIPHLSF